MKIDLQKTASPKPKPAGPATLGFGKVFTDHMFLMNYNEGKGWHSPRIVPYGPLSFDPATSCLHYGQLIFEGLKAYKTPQGKTVMFRPGQNVKRLNASGARICIPPVDEDFLLEAIAELVRLEKDWVPSAPGTSLYIRPFIMGTEDFLGVHPSSSYLLCVILSPSGSYYAQGLAPVRIHVEEKHVRAVKGGTGIAKSAGNYAGSMVAQIEAQAKGFAQVLWLDGIERKYIEEVGAMNIFFVIDGQVVTPELGGSILPGITRASVLEMLGSWGIPAAERKISIEEISQAYGEGKLEEVFGTGTAAVIAPVGELKWGEQSMSVGGGEIGPITARLYENLTGIQTCRRPDPFGWVYTVDG